MLHVHVGSRFWHQMAILFICFVTGYIQSKDTMTNVGRRWLNNGVYRSVIRRLMVHACSVPFTLTIHNLSVGHKHAPASAADWVAKGCVMCYHVYVQTLVKDHQL